MTDLQGRRPRVGHCRSTARRLVKTHKVSDYPTPLDRILENEGLQVIERDWALGVSGILVRDRRVIGVNSNHAPVRKRFTVAHELGHFVLEHHLWYETGPEITIDNPPARGCEGEDKALEQEANIFASELLAPLAILKKVIQSVRDPRDLARRFEMSEQAMFIALSQHNLLNKL